MSNAVIPEKLPSLWRLVVPPLMSATPVDVFGLWKVSVFGPERTRFTEPPIEPVKERSVALRLMTNWLPAPPIMLPPLFGVELSVKKAPTTWEVPFRSSVAAGPPRTKATPGSMVLLPPLRRRVPRERFTVPESVLELTPEIPMLLAGEARTSVPSPSFTKPALPSRVLLTFSVVLVSAKKMSCTAALLSTGTVNWWVAPPVARTPPAVRVNWLKAAPPTV